MKVLVLPPPHLPIALPGLPNIAHLQLKDWQEKMVANWYCTGIVQAHNATSRESSYNTVLFYNTVFANPSAFPDVMSGANQHKTGLPVPTLYALATIPSLLYDHWLINMASVYRGNVYRYAPSPQSAIFRKPCC